MSSSSYSYNEYCNDYTKVHIWISFIIIFMSGFGALNISFLLNSIELQQEVIIKKEMFGLIYALIGLPIILFMQLNFKRGNIPSKKVVIGLVVACFVVVTIGYETSPKLYRSYLTEHGYVFCKKYSTRAASSMSSVGSGSSKAREIWQYKKCD